MATVESNIERALIKRAEGLAPGLVPVASIAWPNSNFTRPSDANGFLPYLAVDHMPNESFRYSLKGSEPRQRKGILQIRVSYPKNKGRKEPLELAGLVAAHFPADLALFEDGVKVSIVKVDVASAISNDVSWDVPVSVFYEANA